MISHIRVYPKITKSKILFLALIYCFMCNVLTLSVYCNPKQKPKGVILIIDSVNTEPLLKVFKKFELFRKNLTTEQEQAGAIQAFEYCFELSWKTMKRLLEARGKTGNSPREVFRMAGLEGFIKDPEIWFDFIKKRNLTVHTYEEEEAKEVINVLPLFSQEMHTFLKNIGI